METESQRCSDSPFSGYSSFNRGKRTTAVRLACHRLWLLLCPAMLLLSGCKEEERSTLRIGLNAWPGYEFLYLAQERGYYTQEGVRVELVELSSLSDTRRAYERGTLDGFGTTLIDALQSRHSTPPGPQVVRVVDHSNGADVIVTRAGIPDVKSLKGCRVGVEMVSLGIYILSRALEKAGLNLTNVTPVYTDSESMARDLAAGKLDAIVTYPPFSIPFLNKKEFNPVFSSLDLPGEVVDVIAFDSKIVATRAAEVQRVLRAFSRAVAFTQRDPETAMRIMAQREGISPAEFKSSLQNGMSMLGDQHQAAYLGPDGKLWELMQRVDWVMRQVNMIRGEERIRDSYTDRCLPKEDSLTQR